MLINQKGCPFVRILYSLDATAIAHIEIFYVNALRGKIHQICRISSLGGELFSVGRKLASF